MKKYYALLAFILLINISGFCQVSEIPSSITERVIVSTLIVNIKDIVNIIFFIIVSIVTILSYLQARKTIFTPLKTEIFKMQLKSFEEILAYFNETLDGKIDNKFDFENMVNLNASLMYDDYIEAFFSKEIKLNTKHREEIYKNLVGAIISKDYMEKHFELVDYSIKPEKKEIEKIENPAVVFAKWQEYTYGAINFTQKYDEQNKILGRFLANPVLPTQLKVLIQAFSDQCHNNLSIIGDILTEVAKEMPTKYPNIDTIRKADLSWIWSKYINKRILLLDAQANILKFLSDYLSIDKILK